MVWLVRINAGSRLAADGVAANAFMVTHMAAAMGALTWVFAEWIFREKPTTLGLASGAVAGLGSITGLGVRGTGRCLDHRWSSRNHLLFRRAFEGPFGV